MSKVNEIKVNVELEKWFNEVNYAFANVVSSRINTYIIKKEAIKMAEEFALLLVNHAVKVNKPMYIDSYNHDIISEKITSNEGR